MIINEEQYGISTGQRADLTAPQPKISPLFWGDTVPAAFRLENPVSSMAVQEATSHPSELYDPEYDAYSDLGEYEGTREAMELIEAKNPNEMLLMKKDLARQKQDEQIINDAGGLGTLASVMAGVASPTTLIPGYNLVKGGRAVSIAGGALRGSASAGGAIAIDEALLQQSQVARSPVTTTLSVGGGVILGGVMGGGVSAISRKQFSDAATKLERDVVEPPAIQPSKELTQYMKSVGAAMVDKPTLSDLTISGAAALTVSRASRFVNPFNRLANSPFTTSRETLLRGFETTLEFNLHRDGKTLGPAAETQIKLFDKYNAISIMAYKENFKAFKAAESNYNFGRKISGKEFRERLSSALRNGDVDQEIEEVTRAAQRLRAEVLDPIKDQAIEAGLLPKDITPSFAKSYLYRMWDRQKLLTYRDEAMAMLNKWAEGKIAKEADRLAAMIKKADGEDAMRLRIERESLFDPDGKGFKQVAEQTADEVYAKLTGIGSDTVPGYISPLTRGPLKEKLLDISDNDAAMFLKNDAIEVLNSYVHKMGSDIALTRVFGRADMKDQLDALAKEFQEALGKAKTPAERRKLEKAYRSDKSDLEAMRDLLRGHFNKHDPDSVIAQGGIALRDLTYMTSMGGVALSSVPDIARHTMVNGINRSFGDLLDNINLAPELRKMRVEDLKESGFLVERILASRLMTLADVNDPLARGSMLTRFTGSMSQGFSKLTLINHWNDIQKAYAATITQNRILRTVSGNDFTDADISYLRFLGIDEAQQSIIRGQYLKHGARDGEAFVAGIKNWDDTPAVRNAEIAYKAALRKEADTVVVTKGVADAPIVSNTPIGKLLFQFTGFLFGAHQRVLLRGLQQADAGAALGLTMMIAAGSLVAAIKQMEAEKSAELTGLPLYGSPLAEWDNAKLLYEGVDRSGILGLMGDFNNRFEKMGGYGLTRAMGVEEPARYTNRSKSSVLLGPGAGKMESLLTVGIAPFDNKPLTDQEIKAARGLIPFQNITGIRHIFDEIQGEAVGE
jgi:hypothetical protein